jgi:rod shape-determining protein MreD
MHWIALLIATYVAALVEISLSDLSAVRGITPDLLALVLIVRLLYGPAKHQVAAAFFVGLFSDLATPGQVGIGLASSVLLGWLVTRRGQFAFAGATPWGVLIVLLLVSITTLAAAVVRQILGELDLPWASLPLRSLGVGVYTAGFSLPVLMVAAWMREPASLLRRA